MKNAIEISSLCVQGSKSAEGMCQLKEVIGTVGLRIPGGNGS